MKDIKEIVVNYDLKQAYGRDRMYVIFDEDQYSYRDKNFL